MKDSMKLNPQPSKRLLSEGETSSRQMPHTPDRRGAIVAKQLTIPPLLIDVHDAARAMSICERTLASMTKAGEIPHVRVRTRVLYDPRALSAWIDGQVQGGRVSVDGAEAVSEK